jgi:hypothetical protein
LFESRSITRRMAAIIASLLRAVKRKSGGRLSLIPDSMPADAFVRVCMATFTLHYKVYDDIRVVFVQTLLRDHGTGCVSGSSRQPAYFTLSVSERRFSIGFQRHRARKADCKSALQTVGLSCGS